eukprot:TRINITY_DN18230_c0_g1_i1.p1 TRINITY_DN18230_c0_g1~~TRINITY_DN18230_c0_g1_i1.p1  ORF type:complete len:179 (-),score=19.67 TRINITY_DN18230_c0_g1_i1:3-482(-)
MCIRDRFNTMGISLQRWYSKLPRKLNKAGLLINPVQMLGNATGKGSKSSKNYNLEQFYRVKICILCLNQSENHLCESCRIDPRRTHYLLQEKLNLILADDTKYQELCRSCSKLPFFIGEESPCHMLDCPIFYSRTRARDMVRKVAPTINEIIMNIDRLF